MTKCRECDGTGEKFILPRGNPFNMKLPVLAQAMRKVQCFHCHGNGYLRGGGLEYRQGSMAGGLPDRLTVLTDKLTTNGTRGGEA